MAEEAVKIIQQGLDTKVRIIGGNSWVRSTTVLVPGDKEGEFKPISGDIQQGVQGLLVTASARGDSSEQAIISAAGEIVAAIQNRGGGGPKRASITMIGGRATSREQYAEEEPSISSGAVTGLYIRARINGIGKVGQVTFEDERDPTMAVTASCDEETLMKGSVTMFPGRTSHHIVRPPEKGGESIRRKNFFGNGSAHGFVEGGPGAALTSQIVALSATTGAIPQRG